MPKQIKELRNRKYNKSITIPYRQIEFIEKYKDTGFDLNVLIIDLIDNQIKQIDPSYLAHE
jgi:FMN-dependent NADH-azoreductase